MNIQLSNMVFDKRTKQSSLQPYLIMNDAGERIGLPDITPDIIKEIMGSVDIVNIFHEDGDILSEIEEISNMFVVKLAQDSDWVDCEATPMRNGKGYSIKRERSTAIRGKESVLKLLEMFSEVLSPEAPSTKK